MQGCGSTEEETAIESNQKKEKTAVNNDQSNNVNITALNVAATISPGKGHGSRDIATSSNKSVSNVAKEVKVTGNDSSNIVDIIAFNITFMIASDDDNKAIEEARIVNSDTETEKSNDNLAKEKNAPKTTSSIPKMIHIPN